MTNEQWIGKAVKGNSLTGHIAVVFSVEAKEYHSNAQSG